MATYDEAAFTLVGIFDDAARARAAVEELRCAGFGDDQIGVLARSDPRLHLDDTTLAVQQESRAVEGAAGGAVAGASVGALWALAIAAGVLPAIGPVVAGGMLAAVAASALAAGAVGGLIGALVGLGIPDDEAHYYLNELKAGKTLVLVHTGNRYPEAAHILEKAGGYVLSQGIHDEGTVPPEHVRGRTP